MIKLKFLSLPSLFVVDLIRWCLQKGQHWRSLGNTILKLIADDYFVSTSLGTLIRPKALAIPFFLLSRQFLTSITLPLPSPSSKYPLRPLNHWLCSLIESKTYLIKTWTNYMNWTPIQSDFWLINELVRV